MEQSLRTSIWRAIDKKSTTQLREIYNRHNEAMWTPEAFEIISEILKERDAISAEFSIHPHTGQFPLVGGLIGLIAGGLLGYPLSYYFQPGALRAKVSLGEYIRYFSKVIGDKDLQSSVILGFVVAIGVCVAAGFVIGRALDQKK